MSTSSACLVVPDPARETTLNPFSKNIITHHIGVGDVLLKELDRAGSPHRATVRTNTTAGSVGPKRITVAILKEHILKAISEGSRHSILDGMC